MLEYLACTQKEIETWCNGDERLFHLDWRNVFDVIIYLYLPIARGCMLCIDINKNSNVLVFINLFVLVVI